MEMNKTCLFIVAWLSMFIACMGCSDLHDAPIQMPEPYHAAFEMCSEIQDYDLDSRCKMSVIDEYVNSLECVNEK